MRLIPVLSTVSALLFAPSVFAADDLRPGDIITGKLQIVRTRHPNGTRIVAYQLTTDARHMLKDEFCVNEDGAGTFHLVVANPEAEKRLKALRNKAVSVAVDEFSCAQTAWHIGDAVVFKWRFAPPPG